MGKLKFGESWKFGRIKVRKIKFLRKKQLEILKFWKSEMLKKFKILWKFTFWENLNFTKIEILNLKNSVYSSQ